MRNQYDSFNCLEQGNSAEELFRLTAYSKGYFTTPATKKENIYSHIDIWILKHTPKQHPTPISIDVKASKRISRSDDISSTRDDLLWIELHSVRPNNKGWLYEGKADYIAFEQTDCFILIKRDKLIELIPLHTGKTFVSTPDQAKGKLYRRHGRCDLLTIIDTSIVLPFSHIWTKP